MDHLSKLNVSGELANVDNADLFKAGAAVGSWILTVTAQDSLGNPVADVDVTLRAAGSTVTARRTGTAGTVAIPINDGVYTVYLYRFGWTFADTEITISGADQPLAVTGSDNALAIPAPSDPSDCRVWERLRGLGASSDPFETAEAFAIIYQPEFADDDAIYYAGRVEGVYDSATGIVYWDVVAGATVRFSIPEWGLDTARVVPAATTARLYDLTAVEIEE